MAEASATGTDPLQGIRVWTNPKNKFTVCRLHYTADPAKRSPTWIARTKEGMPERGWKREYEISFETPAGEPVFPEFDPARMIRPILTLPEARLLRGWDFGHVCPAVVFAQIDAYDRLRILDNLILRNSSIEVLIEAAVHRSWELIGRHVEAFDAGDPAGESFTDLGQVRQIMLDHGLVLHTNRNRKESYEALRQRMLASTFVHGEGVSPKFLTHPRASTLNEALTGGFHKSEKPPFKPVELHPEKDVVDAVRYLHDNLIGAQGEFMQQMRDAARADYAW